MQKITKILKNKLFIGILVAILAIIGFFVFKGKGAQSDTMEVKKDDFTKTVSISGKVVASESVDLAFETGGTVVGVYKKVGDKVYGGEVIATLDAGDLVASRDKAKADLAAAQAELAKVQSGQQSFSEVDINREQIVNTIADAYAKSDDAIRNKVDQFFSDPRSSAAKIKYSFYNDSSLKYQINEDRQSLEKSLVDFKAFSDSLSASNYSDQSIKTAKDYVQKVKAFLDEVAPAVNSFSVDAGLSQTMIDKYKSDVANARTNVSNSLTDLSAYEDKLRSSTSDVPVQLAKVASAEATVRNYDAQITKTVIVAPFNGVVSVQDAKVGESVAPHVTVSSLISTGLLIEVYIPEISIPGIALKNKAVVTLDAYPDVPFDAVVTHIDPAETVRDGVSNYKVKLSFANNDARIISGLTGDVSIETQKKPNVLSVPDRSIVTTSGKYYVYKKTKDASIKAEVTLGVKDGKGNTEILSGIDEGDIILLNPPIN